MKRVLLSVLLGFSLMIFCLAQTSETVAAINAIKMDSQWLYGESTELEPSAAESQAMINLQSAVRQYLGAAEDVRFDSTAVHVFRHPRGASTRVFACIPVESLSLSKRSKSYLSSGLETFLQVSSGWDEVSRVLKQKRNIERFSFGTIDITTEESVLNNCYLIVVRAHNKIVGIYRPKSESGWRLNLKSGVETTVIDYLPGDTVHWLFVNDNK